MEKYRIKEIQTDDVINLAIPMVTKTNMEKYRIKEVEDRNGVSYYPQHKIWKFWLYYYQFGTKISYYYLNLADDFIQTKINPPKYPIIKYHTPTVKTISQ